MTPNWAFTALIALFCGFMGCLGGVLNEDRIEKIERRLDDMDQQYRGLDSDLRWLGRCVPVECNDTIEYRRERHEKGFLF